MWSKLLLLALAGGIGTLGRFSLGKLVSRWAGDGDFPWHTLAVNVVGCFLFGLVGGILSGRIAITHHLHLAIFVGLLGGFTTFSAFAAESGRLVDQGKWMLAFSNIALQNVVGVGVFIAGISLGKIFP